MIAQHQWRNRSVKYHQMGSVHERRVSDVTRVGRQVRSAVGDSENECRACFWKYNAFLSHCFCPVLDLVDPGNTCGWQGKAELSEEVVFICIYHLIDVHYYMTDIFIKLCSALHKWIRCVRMDQHIGAVCLCEQPPFNLYIEMMNKQCVHNIMWEYTDCIRNVNITAAIIARHTPRYECDFHSLETVVNNASRLMLFSLYMLHLSSDNSQGEQRARLYCTVIQWAACMERRMENSLCPDQFPMNMTEALGQIYHLSLQGACQGLPQCEEYAKLYCKLEPQTFTVRLLTDVNDISRYYNNTSRHVFIKRFLDLGDLLLNYDLTKYNISDKCDGKKLLFRQAGCVYKTMAYFDLDQMTEAGYVVDYMYKQMVVYDSCWAVYKEACRIQADKLNYHEDVLRGWAQYYSH